MSAAKAVRRFANGAMMLELDGVRFTMSHTGRISWACPAGWTRIVGDEKTFPVMERSEERRVAVRAYVRR